MKYGKKIICTLLGACFAVICAAQTDTVGRKSHFSGAISAWARGEIRDGALPAENGEDFAAFLMGKTSIKLEYTSPWLDVRFSPKFFGVWGSSSSGKMGVDEAWFGLKSPVGLFLRVGRQALSYDDQRIIGDDDWAMAPITHDVVKAGFEGGKHKVHLLLAFNQNDENLNGGTVYLNGGQDYKSMQTLWYHCDPLPWLGGSLIAMNMGMQSRLPDESKSYYQQLFGAFLDVHPKDFSFQASYYMQTGRDEYALPIHAWMASAESNWQINRKIGVNAGYFHMSGDPYFFVPPENAFGMARKTEIRGFNPMFGSHHKFYGAMDFFYVSTYYGGNTPGLQDLHIGATWSPSEALDVKGACHYLATSVSVDNKGRALGHEWELSVNWKLASNVSLQAGYSFMHGTEIMTLLKRSSEHNRLQWGWIMLVITPELFKL